MMICPWKAPWAVCEERKHALTCTATYRKQMCKLGNESDKSEPMWQPSHKHLELQADMMALSSLLKDKKLL